MSVVATTPVKSAPKRTTVKAVPECLRNRAPPPPKGTPLQQTATCHVPPSDPPPESAEAQLQRWHIDADVNLPGYWCARERVPIQSLEDYVKRSEKFNVAITELQQFLLSLGDNASCILTFAENVCDEHGRK